MHSLRAVHSNLLLEASIDSVIRMIRRAAVMSGQHDVHDLAEKVLSRDPSLREFVDAFLSDYNEFVKADPELKDEFKFTAKSLRKLSTTALNKGFAVLKTELTNLVSNIDVDAIIDAVVNRLKKFSKSQLEQACDETSSDYGEMMSMIRRLSRYVHSDNKQEYDAVKRTLLYYAEDFPDDDTFEKNIVGMLEQKLAKFEEYARKAPADDQIDVYVRELNEVFGDVGDKYIKALTVRLSASGLYDARAMMNAYVDERAKGGNEFPARLKHLANGTKNVPRYVERIISEWEKFGELIYAYVDKKPTDEQKQVVLSLVDFVRKYAAVPLARDVAKFYNLRYSILDIARQVAAEDPQVGEKSIEKLLEEVLYAQLHSNPVQLSSVKEAIDEVDRVQKYTKEFNDQQFQEALDGVVSILNSVRKVGFDPYDSTFMSTEDNRKLGPAGADEGIMFFRSIRDLYTELKRGQRASALIGMLNDNKAPSHEKSHVFNILSTFMDPWRVATDEERSTLVDKMKEITSEFLEKARKFDIELRKKNPPEVKKGAKFRPLDDYAFADARAGKVPTEADNENESRLYRAIRKHFSDNIPLKKPEAEEIKKILTKGAYSKIFHPPKGTWLFRGMGASNNYLRRILKLKEDEEIPKTGSKTASFTYTPRGEAGGSSWTTKVSTAKNFRGDETDFNVIMQASQTRNPDTFVAGPSGLYDVPGFDSYSEEAESIGLGDIKVSKIYWIKSGSGEFKPSDLPADKGAKKPTKKPVAKKKTTSSKKKATTSKKPAKKVTKK